MNPTDDNDTDLKTNITYASYSEAFFSSIKKPTEYWLSPRTKPGKNIGWLAFFPGISPLTIHTPIENAHPDTTSHEKKNN